MDVNSVPVASAESSGRCRFPVGWDAEAHDFLACGRPTVPVNSEDGRGRPTGYCDDPQHKRERASAERRRIRRALEQATPDDLGRPVTHARAAGEHFLDEVRKVAEPLTENLGRLLEAIDSMTDPELVAEQLAMIDKDHQLEKAQLEARLTKAERAERELRARLEESEAEAEDSTKNAELALWLHAELVHRLAEKHSELVGWQGQYLSLTAELQAETERAADLEQQLEAQTTRADNGEQVAVWLLAEERHRATTEIRAAQETARSEAEQIRRQAAEDIERVERAADERVRTIEDEAAEKVRDADRARAEALGGRREAELEAAKAAQAAEDWRREAGLANTTVERLREQMDDLRTSQDQQLDSLRRSRDEDLRTVREEARIDRERLETTHSQQIEGLTQALASTQTALESLSRPAQSTEADAPDRGSPASE